MDKAQQDALKKAAGIEAAKLVENGMIAGLGTGSTVKFLVDELGRRHQEEGLEFTGVTTSRRTQAQAESYGIKIVDIDDVDHIDVTIDGADEVDKNFNGIKGGGAALLWEKIVATNSNQIVWIVDESKVVDTIGKFPLPVEVIPFGAGQVIKKFEARGYKPVLRLDADGKEVRTDENNFVVDLHLERIDHPQDLAEDLINTVGVVEHGLFLNMVDKVIVGDPNGVCRRCHIQFASASGDEDVKAPRPTGSRGFVCALASERLLALVASLTQHLAVLLLAHPLAALLDDRTHRQPPLVR